MIVLKITHGFFWAVMAGGYFGTSHRDFNKYGLPFFPLKAYKSLNQLLYL